MGLQQINEVANKAEMRRFVKSLLDDLHALERMIAEGWIESGVRRIGAEQEMFLVDRAMQPAKLANVLLGELGSEHFTTELGLFNLEANLSPQVLGGDCFARLERELVEHLARAREAARRQGGEIVLCGILPTLEKSHLTLDFMTPSPRYMAMNRLLTDMRGGRFDCKIKGVDELQTSHDNVMLEACTTSFQVHYQVSAEEFADAYNLAQVATAPALAVAVNSPVLLQHRLWHETRVALFQQSLDTRSELLQQRGARQRVNFGDRWVKESILEIFREDVARFRTLIAIASDEHPMALLDEGKVPQLRALRLHNGTVYRWNRPCYGITNGKAHLRIENRVMPAGPSVQDEIANAAFFVGLMAGGREAFGDVTTAMGFDDARANFVAAARYGLNARFRWFKGKAWSADELVTRELLPLARAGLTSAGVAAADVERTLGVIEERVKRGRTGAQWALDSLGSMRGRGRLAERYRALTAAMLARQTTGAPVHTWELAQLEERDMLRESYRTVGQLMVTDLFTVRPEDIVDLAASLMDWQHIRYVPVEDDQGKLVGLLSHRSLLRVLARGAKGEPGPVTVRDSMRTDLVTVSPETSTLEAIDLMRRNKVGCLPVVQEGRLVGIVTEHDFVELATGLLDRWLRED